MRGRRYAIPFARVWKGALDLIEARGARWTVIQVDDQAGTITVEARTRLLGFVDDVTIRIGLDTNGQVRVDLHSVSRVGWWDLGANARRIRTWLRDLDRALDARPRDILPAGGPHTPEADPGSGVPQR